MVHLPSVAILRPEHLRFHPLHFDFMVSREDLSTKGSHVEAKFLFAVHHTLWASSSAKVSMQR